MTTSTNEEIIMKLLNALVQDVTVATKTQFDSIVLTKPHTGGYLVTLKTNKDYNKIQLIKLFNEKLANMGVNKSDVTLRLSENIGRKETTVKVSISLVEGVADKEISRIPLTARKETLSTSLQDYLVKYGVQPSNWKSNSTKGLIEIYGVNKSVADKVPSLIAGFYQQYGVSKNITVNEGKDGTYNVRVKKV